MLPTNDQSTLVYQLRGKGNILYVPVVEYTYTDISITRGKHG